MSKLETNTIDTISGSTTLTLGGTNATTIAQDAATTVTGFKSTGIDDNATSTAITIDSSENVGIGTSSPGTKLDIVSDSSARGIYLRGRSADNIGLIDFRSNDGSTRYASIGSQSANTFSIETNSVERMRITSSGGVNVGSEGTAGTAVGLNVHNHGWSTMATFKTGTSTNAQYVQFINSNGVVGSINMSGSSTSYNTSSDYRLKENIVEITDATTRLKQLKPKRFNFIADADTTVDGFLAHEVSSVVPEAISGEKDAVQVWEEGDELPEGVSVGDNKLDENGNTIPKYQGIDQSKLVPLLVKTIQELEARITQLENA